MNEVCGTCKYHKNVDNEWICTNNEAYDCYGLETEYGDSCEMYEERIPAWKGR